MALGLEQHLLEALTVPLLDPAPARDLGLGAAQSFRERVAHQLELRHPEDPRAAGRCHAPVDSLAGEGGGEELAQAALEECNLTSKLRADPAVGEQVLARRKRSLGDRRRCRGRVPVKQLLGQTDSLRPRWLPEKCNRG